MKKVISIFIPIVILIIFIVIMLSGNYLKYTLNSEDNIPKTIETVIENVEREQWDKASREIDNLEKIWTKVVKRIQFSSERDEINAFNCSLARTKGAIKGHNVSATLIELNEAYEHWKRLAQ